MSGYFSKPKCLGGKVKVELHLSNYATKADLKNAAGVDTSDFTKDTDLTNLKSDVDRLDINKFKNVASNLSNWKSKVDKLVPVPVDLSKLNDIVKNDAVKKTKYDELVKKLTIT